MNVATITEGQISTPTKVSQSVWRKMLSEFEDQRCELRAPGIHLVGVYDYSPDLSGTEVFHIKTLGGPGVGWDGFEDCRPFGFDFKEIKSVTFRERPNADGVFLIVPVITLR